MTSSWRIARPSLDQIAGVLLCAVAAGPIAVLVVTINETLQARSPVTAVSEMLSVPVVRLMLGWAVASLFALPSVGAIALGTIPLARANRDTFLVSFACGTACAYVAISITCLITIGEAPGFDFGHPSNVSDAALMVLACSIGSALYWLVAVRRQRSRRQLAAQHERALRAME